MTTKYQAHRHKWGQCVKCELSRQRNRVVLARGMLPSEVLFVGEAPGASEDVIGRPFCGPAGKLLDHIIERGFDGQLDYAITNLVACYPKEAKQTEDHRPPIKSIKACGCRLREIYKICQPKMVVCVGTLSQEWTPDILDIHDGKYICGVIHPAAILRMPTFQQPLAIKRSIAVLDAVLRVLHG